METAAYRAYVTDGVRMMTESMAKLSGGQFLTARYTDIINRKPEDTRTGAEIAADVIKNAGLVVITE